MLNKKIGDTCLFQGIEYGLGCVTDEKIGLELLKKYGVKYRIFLSPLIEMKVLKLYEKYLSGLNKDR